MKIKSITDVITNSSTEVYLIKTSESENQLSDWLDDNIYGWANLHKIESSSDPDLKELIDYEYLYDSKSKKSIMEYHLKCVFCECNLSLGIAWVKFIRDHRYRINKYCKRTIPWRKGPALWPGNKLYIKKQTYDNHVEFIVPDCITDDYSFRIPYGLYKKFVKQYKGPKPLTWELPKELDVNSYIGCYAFSSSYDNSIPYEDMKKIDKKYNTNSYHLG